MLMEDQHYQPTEVVMPRRPWWRTALYVVIAIIFLLVVALEMAPTLHGPHRRQVLKETSAVGRLRMVGQLEYTYSANSPTKAVTCDLRELMPLRSEAERYGDSFFLEGRTLGYTYSMLDCRPGADGVIRTYQLTAVPTDPGASGIRAFCSDQSGAIWYDDHGSALECVEHGTLLR